MNPYLYLANKRKTEKIRDSVKGIGTIKRICLEIENCEECPFWNNFCMFQGLPCNWEVKTK